MLRYKKSLACDLVLGAGRPLAWAQDKIRFVPSPRRCTSGQRMLEVAELKSGDSLYDMGSGDGRIITEAAKKYGARGVGIDLDPELVAKATENTTKKAPDIWSSFALRTDSR